MTTTDTTAGNAAADTVGAEGTEGSLPEATSHTEQTTDGSTSREAAKYRTRLRESEASLTAATERIAALQRAEAERLASTHLAEPGDVWALGGKELADLLDPETGDVSAELVTALAESIAKARPGLRKPSRAVDPSQGRGTDVRPSVSWDGLLKR